MAESILPRRVTTHPMRPMTIITTGIKLRPNWSGFTLPVPKLRHQPRYRPVSPDGRIGRKSVRPIPHQVPIDGSQTNIRISSCYPLPDLPHPQRLHILPSSLIRFQKTHYSPSNNLLEMPARNPKTDPATPVIISILSSCQAITEIMIATTVPQTMARKTCGRTFDNKIFILLDFYRAVLDGVRYIPGGDTSLKLATG